MHLLEQYVNNFNTNNPRTLASTFDRDCVFSDMAPTKAGMDPMWVYGSECVEMIFQMYFASMEMKLELVKIEGNVLDYVVHYPGFGMPCRGTLLEEKDGKIVRYSVRYRED